VSHVLRTLFHILLYLDRTRLCTHLSLVHLIFRDYIAVSIRLTIVPNSPILSSFYESLIQIGSDYSIVQLGSSNVLHAIQRVLMCVVFDKAESAWCLLEAIKTHDQTLNLAAF
jgi:hypothetical protein